ncbi:hypothetical protein PPTG_23878 [Phytophthora nicotianae INRA-310]|uniref:Uncharacterized protein n=1 Tax=Phytophthora nicotianae (strain INRA-310) TaxID=761204 RepID=W2PR73_PHYN3|nr:hypothetical protein PPTG_23878 [Phytophthora nicotianae INRA-310]ETN02734.1 hypothetical protein PPTG_23878 [Phytophthora nicotianae INRA-310]
MSDDEQVLSEDDGADLFESDSEDQGSETELSLALPSLSLDSSDVRSPDHHGLDEGAEHENTDCATDQNVDNDFGVGVESCAAKTEGEGHELYVHEDISARADGDDPGLAELQTCRSSQDKLPSEKYEVRNEDDVVTQPPAVIALCESPKLPDPDDHQTIDADQKSLDSDKIDNNLSITEQDDSDHEGGGRGLPDGAELTPRITPSTENSTEIRDTSASSADKTVRFEPSNYVPLPAAHEELTTTPNPAQTQLNEDTNDQNTPDKTSNENLQLPAEINPSHSTDATKPPVYTIESLFPVVYEDNIPISPGSEIAQVVPISSGFTNTKKPTRRRRAQIDDNPDKTIASRLAALQARLDAAKNELVNATRTLQLKLSIVETDNKKLSERNARLKTQLSLATANLQRTTAEMIRLNTENEVYAAKLPQLQAELLDETSQVDETQAQSVQTQLALTQLRARSHVLQTRKNSLEAQNNKLTQKLRECQQQLRRKTAALQQQTEKANKFELDLNQLKTTHTQEKLDWKNRLTAALKRFEHDKTKLENEFKAAERKVVREMKGRAEKALKKRRTAEATTVRLNEQLKQCKWELSSANDMVLGRTNEVRTLEALLRKAHRTEATLRNDLAICKTRLHSLQDEKKRSMARSGIVRTRRHRLGNQVPIEMLLTDSSDDEDQDNQTISTFQTISNAWDESLGGSKFDLRLAEHLAKEFSEKIGEDIRKVPRPMAKIRAQAKKTKTVLSANEEIPVVMQSLYNDIDFFTSMTRSKLEELSSDLFDRTLKPVEVALEKAGLTAADIDEIEIIGGGVRMPKIQQQLTEFFDGKDLGVHLNGDEAMALGAAFRAANLSNSFRVRQVGMTDIASYPIGVRLVDLSATEPTDSNNDDEVETKQWMKRAALFSESHRLGLRKSVSFSHSKDVSCTFRYDKPSMLPAGVSVQIAKFNITGVEKFAARMAEKNLGEPKVTLSFELDSNGIAQIAKAEATLEEEVEVEVVVKKEKKSKKTKKEDSSADSSEAGDEEEAEEKPETRMEKQIKTHREKLTVVRAHETREPEEGMSVLSMSEAVKKESMRMLNEMEKADNKRRADLEAKNNLETFIYKAHDALSAQESDIKQVTVPEQIESLQTKLDETEEWLYDDGDKVEAAEYKKKMDSLDSDLSAILFRVAELKELPIAINTAQEYAFSTRELMTEWSTSKPQVTDEERSDVLEKIDELEAWLTESEASQKAAPKYEKPVVTSADVAKKVQGVKKFVAVLAKRPKPQPVKTDKNDTEKDDSKTEEETSSKDTDTDETAEPEVKETEEKESTDEKDEL